MRPNTRCGSTSTYGARLAWLRYVTLLGATLLGSVLQAQPAPVPAQPYPGDRIGLPVFGGGCPVVVLDPSQVPRIRHTGSSGGARDYELRYWSHVPPNQACGVPPPMRYDFLVDIGSLPVGTYRFTVIGHLDGDEFDRYTTNVVSVRDVGYGPRADISGVWYAPEQSGRGVFVARRNGFTGVWWSNHDADGDPAWVIMTVNNAEANRFEGEAITTHGPPMAAGPADIDSQRWGELSFTYLGCGRAQMAWNADDEAIGDGSLNLVQLVLPDGIEPCDISSRVQGPPAIWEAALAE